jgi:hypothetical protein
MLYQPTYHDSDITVSSEAYTASMTDPGPSTNRGDSALPNVHIAGISDRLHDGPAPILRFLFPFTRTNCDWAQ